MASGLGGSELGGRGLCGRAGMEVGGMMEVVGGLIIFSATAYVAYWIVSVLETLKEIAENTRPEWDDEDEGEEGE